MLKKKIAFAGAAAVLFALSLSAAQDDKKPVASSAQEEKKPADDDAVAKGKVVFEEQCSVCHSVVEGEEKKIGPVLKDLYKHAKLKNGSPVNDENVKKIVVEGGNGMPAMGDVLEKDQLGQVLAYLKTL